MIDEELAATMAKASGFRNIHRYGEVDDGAVVDFSISWAILNGSSKMFSPGCKAGWIGSSDRF